MNWKKSTAIFGLSACLLTMVVPAMAAEDIKAAMPPAAQHGEFGAFSDYAHERHDFGGYLHGDRGIF